MNSKIIVSMLFVILGMSLGLGNLASAASLCEKYGAALPKVVDDFVAKAAPNPKVDFFRKGKFGKVDVPKLKEHLINFMSDAIGCEGKKYKGRDMKVTHKGMKITKKLSQFRGEGASNSMGAVMVMIPATMIKCKIVVRAGMVRIEMEGMPLIL